MKQYKIRYKNGPPGKLTKDLEEQVWQKSAKIIVDEYSKVVPDFSNEQYSVTFIMDYQTEKLTVDNSTMSDSLLAKFQDAHSKGLL